MLDELCSTIVISITGPLSAGATDFLCRRRCRTLASGLADFAVFSISTLRPRENLVAVREKFVAFYRPIPFRG